MTNDELSQALQAAQARLSQVETAVGSIARAPTANTQTVTRVTTQQAQPTLEVLWLASKETVTTSATATSGFVRYQTANVPSNAVAVIVEVYGATAALGGQPTVTVKWKAEAGTAELNLMKFKASSIAGDASGYSGLVMPISGGTFLYEVSSDWSEVEIFLTGFVRPSS